MIFLVLLCSFSSIFFCLIRFSFVWLCSDWFGSVLFCLFCSVFVLPCSALFYFSLTLYHSGQSIFYLDHYCLIHLIQFISFICFSSRLLANVILLALSYCTSFFLFVVRLIFLASNYLFCISFSLSLVLFFHTYLQFLVSTSLFSVSSLVFSIFVSFLGSLLPLFVYIPPC